ALTARPVIYGLEVGDAGLGLGKFSRAALPLLPQLSRAVLPIRAGIFRLVLFRSGSLGAGGVGHLENQRWTRLDFGGANDHRRAAGLGKQRISFSASQTIDAARRNSTL